MLFQAFLAHFIAFGLLCPIRAPLSHFILLGILGPFHHFRAPLSHLGSFVPFVFPWVSWARLLSLGFLSPFPNFALPWAFTNFIGLPRPNYLILILGAHGLAINPYFLCFHYFGPAATYSHFFTSYTAHGLLFLSFRAPLGLFTSSRPICLSHGHVIHYSCHSSLMVFFSIY